MQSQKAVSDYFTIKQMLPFSFAEQIWFILSFLSIHFVLSLKVGLSSWWNKLYATYILFHYFILKGLAPTKIIKKSVILF